MALPYWHSDPEGWDTCSLGFYELPGLTSVKVKRGPNLDPQTAPGQVGARVVFKGTPPGTVTITNRIWEQSHVDSLMSILRNFELMTPQQYRYIASGKDGKTQGAPKAALVISHPVAMIRQVRGVIIQNVDGPNQSGDIWETTIDCLEYLPPLKAPTPAGKVVLPNVQNKLATPTAPSAAIKPRP